MSAGVQEKEIISGIRDGGRIRNVLVVCRTDDKGLEHIAYFRTSWRTQFLPLRTFNNKADRTYRDMDRLLKLIRQDFKYGGLIALYEAGHPELARYKSMAEADKLPMDKPQPEVGRPELPSE